MSPLAIHLMNQRISVVEPHQNGVIGKDSAFQGVQQTLQVLDVVDEKNFAKKDYCALFVSMENMRVLFLFCYQSIKFIFHLLC